VTWDAERLRFEGLPPDLAGTQGVHKMFGVPLAQVPRVAVPGYAVRLPAVLVALRRELLRANGLRAYSGCRRTRRGRRLRARP
jgi:hypothetical protein